MNKFLAIMLLFLEVVTAQTKMSSAEAQALRSMVKEKAATTKTILSDFTQYQTFRFSFQRYQI